MSDPFAFDPHEAEIEAEIEQQRAERDALLPIVAAAAKWRKRTHSATAGSLGWLSPEEGDLIAAVDVLEPTEGAQP